jgi:hypothetical protein
MMQVPSPPPFSETGFITCVCNIDTATYPGILALSPDSESLVFSYTIADTAAQKDLQQTINLIGLLETKLIPDPCSAAQIRTDEEALSRDLPHLLLVTYLEDPYNNDSIATLFFSGLRGDLEDVALAMDEMSTELQSRLDFELPDLTPRTKSQASFDQLHRTLGSSFELINGPSVLFSPPEIEQLRLALPFRMRKLSWERLYLASSDGFSLATLRGSAGRNSPLILSMVTKCRSKFGVYIPPVLRIETGYSGSFESFVFNFAPDLHVYRSTKKNDFLICLTRDDFTVGGGHTGSAFFFTTALDRGVSNPCETFDSPLMTQQTKYDIVDVELWYVRSAAAKPAPTGRASSVV